MTELLCASDAYLNEFDAVVTDVRDGNVVLDRTAFYPTGGGQPNDTGVLRWDGGECRVVDVKKQGGDVLHKIEGEPPPVGTRTRTRASTTAGGSRRRRQARSWPVRCRSRWRWSRARCGGAARPRRPWRHGGGRRRW